jgi:hypothetical protein
MFNCDLEKYAERFMEEREAEYGNYYSCANYLIVYEDGKTASYMDEACHSALITHDSEGRQFYIINVLPQVWEGDDVDSYENYHDADYLVPYLDWIVSESVYADAFLEDSAEQILRQGYCVTPSNIPANYLQSAMIALRKHWEIGHIAAVWWELVQKGVNKELAFVLGHFTATDGDDIYYCATGDGHRIFNGYNLSKSTIKNFMARDRRQLQANADECRCINLVTKLWVMGNDEGREADEFFSSLKLTKTKSTEGPFGRIESPVPCSVAEFSKRIYSHIEEIEAWLK